MDKTEWLTISAPASPNVSPLSAIDLYVGRVQRDGLGMPACIYYLKPGLPKLIRLRVLQAVRKRYPAGSSVSMIGDEIAAFGRELGQ